MQPKLSKAKGGAVPRIRIRTRGSGIQSLNGFTLIEAMIVTLIVAILIALAYPAYIDQVRKARRADGQEALLASAQILERCFTRFNAYNHASCPAVTGASDDGYYIVATPTLTATTYELTATAQGDQANDPCGNFRLDYLGNRSVSGTAPRCWGSSSS